MTTPHTHETGRLQRIIDAHERELEHRANVISEQADELATLRRALADTRAELDDATALGTQYATLGRAFPGRTAFASGEDPEPSGTGLFGF